METDSQYQNQGFGDNQYVKRFVSSAGVFDYYHVPSMKKLFSIEEKENSLHCCDFSKTGEHFATAGKDAHIRIYDESIPQLTQIQRV
jgi:WD40 repeat protein